MKSRTMIAIVLIAAGAVALIYQGVSWTTREKAVDIGPIQVTAERSHSIPLSPIIGGIAVGAGVILLLAGRKTA